MEERRLGFCETLATVVHEVFDSAGMLLHIVHLQGPMTSDLLAAGLVCLQQRQPLLRACLACDPDGSYRFRFAEITSLHPSLLRVVKRENPHHWQAIVDEETVRDFGPDAPFLWRIVFVENEEPEGEHELILVVYHAIADGMSLMHFSSELLTYCQQVLADRPLRPAPFPLLAPMDGMLTLLDKPEPGPKENLFKFAFEHQKPLEECRTRHIYTKIEGEQVQLFRARCKQEQTSLYGGLMAALIWAGYQKFKGDGQKVHIPLGSAVNLRNECNPIVDPGYFACFATTVQTVHPIDGTTSYWELARACDVSLKNRLEILKKGQFIPREFDRNTMEQGMRFHKESGLKAPFFYGGLALSNLGRFVGPLQYGPFTIKEMYTASQHATGSFALFTKVLTLDDMFLVTSYTEGLISRETVTSIVAGMVAEICRSES